MRSSGGFSRLALIPILAGVLGAGACTGMSTVGSVPSPSVLAPLAAEPEASMSHLPLRGPAHPERATIIDGSWLIGADFPPALYLTPTPVTRCHWRVVDYGTGTLIEEGNYAGTGPAAIWVGDGDLFQSEGCYLWQGYPQLTGERVAASPSLSMNPTVVSVADGRWTVGDDIPAGRFRSDRANTGACSYAVTRPDGRVNESFESSATVRSLPAYLDLNLTAGETFITEGCGSWRLVP